MENRTSIKIPKKYEPKIEEVYKDSEKGYWCYTEKGYYFSDADYGIHIIREDTQQQLLEMIRSIEPCNCDECKM
jgi:hypothetical protein